MGHINEIGVRYSSLLALGVRQHNNMNTEAALTIELLRYDRLKLPQNNIGALAALSIAGNTTIARANISLRPLHEMGTLIRATRFKLFYPLLPLFDYFLYRHIIYLERLSKIIPLYSNTLALPQVLAAIAQPSFVTEYIRRKFAQTRYTPCLLAYNETSELAALAFERAVGGYRA